MLIGYGGKLELDILTQALFPETNFVGNICGTYNELGELLEIARRGAVNFRPRVSRSVTLTRR